MTSNKMIPMNQLEREYSDKWGVLEWNIALNVISNFKSNNFEWKLF